jgi:hypothetical protein
MYVPVSGLRNFGNFRFPLTFSMRSGGFAMPFVCVCIFMLSMVYVELYAQSMASLIRLPQTFLSHHATSANFLPFFAPPQLFEKTFAKVWPGPTALQPSTAYRPYSVQPSTALYSSTALHPLQYTTLYSTPHSSGAQCAWEAVLIMGICGSPAWPSPDFFFPVNATFFFNFLTSASQLLHYFLTKVF